MDTAMVEEEPFRITSKQALVLQTATNARYTGVEEIFDVQLLPGLRFPEVIGFQKDAVHHTFVIPPGAPVG